MTHGCAWLSEGSDKEAAAIVQEHERLQAALEPFAYWAEHNDNGEWQDDNDALESLTYGDFRRAREALK